MKTKLEPTSVKCRICGAKHVTLYKDEINPNVYLCKTCKEFLAYERLRMKEDENAGQE